MAKSIVPGVLLLVLCAFHGVSQPISRLPPDLYPRLEASEAEAALFELIGNKLRLFGIPYRSLDFDEVDWTHSFSRSLEVTLPGHRRDTLIICVPLNHPQDVSREASGDINIEIALDLLVSAAQESLPVTLKVLFLSAEFGDEADYPKGSRLFLEEYFPADPVTVVYLNLKATPSRLIVRAGANGIVSPYWLLERCSRLLDRVGLPFLISGNESQLFRMGLFAERVAIEPYLEAGYPAISLEGEYAPLSPVKKQVWFFLYSRFLWGLIDSFEDGMPTEWDHHYLFFQIFKNYLMLPESIYLIVLAVVVGLSLLLVQIFSGRFLSGLRGVLRWSWSPLLLFGVWFLFFLAATLLIDGIQWLRNSPDLWQTQTILFLVFKIFSASLLFIALLPLIRKLPFPKDEAYFSHSAILLLLLDIAVLAVFNISFTYYFLWAYCFALLSAAFNERTRHTGRPRKGIHTQVPDQGGPVGGQTLIGPSRRGIIIGNRIARAFFIALSPFWVVKGLFDMFAYPKLEFCREVLLSRYWGNLLMAILFLPFILLIIRLGYVLSAPKRRTLRRVGLLICGATEIALIGLFLLYQPFSFQNRQKVMIVNIIDAEQRSNKIEINSTAPLGRLYYWRGDSLVGIDSSNREYIITEDHIPELLAVETESTPILNRKNVVLRLHPKGRPYKVDLTLSSEDDYVLFDSNFPFARQINEGSQTTTYAILVGKNPPRPLSVLLTLPKNRIFRLSIEMEYLDPPVRLDFSGKNKRIRTIVVYKQKISIET